MTKKWTLAELTKLTNSTLLGDPNKVITGVSTLDDAGPDDISFLGSDRYLSAMQKSKAGAIFAPLNTKTVPDKNFLLHEHPSNAFQIVLKDYFSDRVEHAKQVKGVHPTAVIHPTALIGNNCSIGAHAVIESQVRIGDDASIGANSTICAHVVVGKSCTLHPNVVVREFCVLKDRVILQPGCVIGSDGFGYTTDQNGVHHKLEQYGNVVIEEDVEIGANTTIDRARFKSTTILKGTKIDNLVQIAHNCTIGPYNFIAAQSGIAGSSKTGHHVYMGGQVGIEGHLTISPQTMIASRTGVSKSLKGGIFSGAPAQPLREYNRMLVHMRNIESLVNEVRDLKTKVDELEKRFKD